MKIVAGNSSKELAYKLASLTQIPYHEIISKKFADGEINIIIEGKITDDVIIVQSVCKPVNDNLMELLLIADCLKQANVNNIVAVVPYLGYGRQNRRKFNTPLSAKLVASMIEAAGIAKVITFDLHSTDIINFYNIQIENLSSINILTPILHANKPDMLVSPDAGGASRVIKIAELLGYEMIILEKFRQEHHHCVVNLSNANVKDKNCFIIDDIIDSGKTLYAAANALIANGAKSVKVFATHGILSAEAINLLEKSVIEVIYLTDTIKTLNILPSKFVITSIADQLTNILAKYRE